MFVAPLDLHLSWETKRIQKENKISKRILRIFLATFKLTESVRVNKAGLEAKRNRKIALHSQESEMMAVHKINGKSQLLVRVACDLFDTPLLPHISLECICT